MRHKLTPEQLRIHREHVRRGLIHISLVLFTLDFIGTTWLLHMALANLEFYSNCGKSGAILATVSCYLEA